jgi:hypothetical protein
MDEISELKSQVAELTARIVQLEDRGGRKSIPAPPEPVTRVITPVAPITVDLPDGKELQQLRDICANTYPAWVDSEGFVFGRRGGVSKEENDMEYLVQFAAAIRAISNMRVLDKPDTKRYVSWHVDTGCTVLRGIGKHVRELRAAPLIMASFVMGVPVSGLGISGASISLGLSEYVGKPVDPSAWRATLKAGRLPPQFAVETRIQSSQGRVEISVAGSSVY